MIDTHVHIANFQTPQPDRLLKSMDAHGVDRLVLFSEEPAYWETDPEKRKRHNAERLDRLFAWCQGSGGRLLPVSFLNPTEPDAIAQVDEALARGAIGFKVICETFYPGDERALPTYRHIANLGKSILFHSGILWDPCDCSKYNRPALFEALMEVPKLTFALAHIGWPWTDEMIAVYGKFMAMRGHPRFTGQHMYIDMTPGTPACYRREVMERLFAVDYPLMAERLLFGSDAFTDDYDARWAQQVWQEDARILADIGQPESVLQSISCNNALRFWNIE